MKILIHGRKNGYTVLFPKPTPTEFYAYASDIQSISANNYDIYYGKCFYTLAFADGGCVFTKYIIGEDVERGQLGEIGISVFIPNTQKLAGQDVKTLLDELIDIYRRNYITNNKIEDPNNGFNWLLFTSMANNYDAKLLSRYSGDDNVRPGTQDPAFHYYKSDIELIEHLNKPFQEEYSDYRQILFIDSNFQGAANPLNVLKNSGIEVNPDLKNEYLYLNNYNRSKGVIITANGNPRSEGKNNNRIRAKWQVEIKYLKDYYKPIIATGTVINSSSDIHKYLDIDGTDIKIRYDAFKPEPETKTFTFDVITKKDGVIVTDAEIQVDTQPWQNCSDYIFSGEELGREHRITAQRGDYLFSDVVKIIPEERTERSIRLPLMEKRIVKITARDQENNDAVLQFTVRITNKYFYKVTDQIEFIEDEINKVWDIQIEKREIYAISEIKRFCPARDGNEIIFYLSKVKKHPIESIHNRDNDPYPGHYKPEKQKSFAGKARTLFSKPAVIAASIVSGLVLSGVILILIYIFGNDKQPEKYNKSDIEKYVSGDSFILDSLKILQEDWKSKEQDFIKKSDSTDWKIVWQPANESIEKAITKRNLIDNKNFAALKKLSDSIVQQYFKTAIERIDSTRYEEVKAELVDVTAFTLSRIADSINAILDRIKQEQPQESIKEGNKPVQKKNTSAKTEQTEKQSMPQEGKTVAPTAQKETISTDEIFEIKQYIRGSDLDTAKLNEYKSIKGISQDLKNSIQLCLDFWELDGSPIYKRTYYTLLQKVYLDNNLRDSKLWTFLYKMDQKAKAGEKIEYRKQDKDKIHGLE